MTTLFEFLAKVVASAAVVTAVVGFFADLAIKKSKVKPAPTEQLSTANRSEYAHR